MSARIREHIRSNVVGYVAVFIALSGTAYAVDGPLPGQNQVGSEDIINGEVFTQDISDSNGVRSADVRDDTLNNGGLQAIDLRADSVGSSEVATDAIGSDEIDNASIGTLDLGIDSVRSAQVFPESLGAVDLAPDSVGSSEVAADSISTGEIVDGQVTNPDLGSNSVTGAKVFPSSLTGADIAANSLSSSDIGTDAVGNDEISSNAVGASEVSNGSLGTAKFASSIPAARVTRTINQGTLNGTFTPLNFNSERYDTAGLHSTASNLSRMVAPVDGVYLVTAQIEWAENGNGARVLRFVKNGATTVARDDRLPGTDRFRQPLVNLSTVTSLADGDFIEAEAFQDSGGNLSVLKIADFSPEFTMTWLAPGP